MPIPFRLDRSNPIADVTFTIAGNEQVQAAVVLDTGAAYYSAVFAPAFARKHQLLERSLTTAIRLVRANNLGGRIEIVSASWSGIAAGPARTDAPIIGVIRTESTLPWEGVLGAGFFRQFTATFDYSRQELWLEPNAHYGERQPFDASGVFFGRDANNEYEVQELVPGSPAAAADLREEDVLESIDGHNAVTLTSKQLAQTLSRPGHTCVLHIRRQGSIRTVTLTLQERL